MFQTTNQYMYIYIYTLIYTHCAGKKNWWQGIFNSTFTGALGHVARCITHQDGTILHTPRPGVLGDGVRLHPDRVEVWQILATMGASGNLVDLTFGQIMF